MRMRPAVAAVPLLLLLLTWLSFRAIEPDAEQFEAWFKNSHFRVTPQINRAMIVKGFLVLGVTLI
jgi:hypothetical protein